MKQILRVIFKTFLLFTLLALAILLVFGLALIFGWPWWVGFFLLIGLLGLVLAVVALRKILVRRRERMFVHQVIEQDEASRQRLAPKEQDSAKELQQRWKEAVDALRRSHLRKFGNPLYVLPWYMVIGESGAGKTTAIKSARLSSPFAEVNRTSGISGTRNCDWWFFEHAVIIDTAGRYAIPVDEGRDKDEWHKFLTYLAKFRKKEPLNGLVVTVAADRLTQADAEALQEDGRSIRRRIDELMHVLGAKFPVYVLMTKCDLIQGAARFCDALPESTLNQAMGILNRDLTADVQTLIDKAFRTVGERLRDLRLLLLNKAKDRTSAPPLLLFPEELEKLKTPLTTFITSAFQENPYQETPLLRGLYLSSGRQEGAPFSHFLKALGLIQSRQVLAGTSKGLFLHDFFAKILPTDRRLFKPTQHMQQWSRLTRNLGLTAWIAIMVAVCGVLSFSFVKNLKTMREVSNEFQQKALLQGDLLADVTTMDRFREALVRVETQNRKWWIPRMGLNESQIVEAKLKQKYVDLYYSGFLNDFDKAMGERMTRFNASTSSTVLGAYLSHLVRRIGLLKARLAQANLDHLAKLPQPNYNPVVLDRENLIDEVQHKLAIEYLYSVVWRKDDTFLNKEIKHLHTWLKHLLSLPNVNLNWLVDWVNADETLTPVTLSDFWAGEPYANAPYVPAAFTQDGQAKINAAIAEIEAVLYDPLVIASKKIDFAKWYHKAYFRAWHDFARNFHKGQDLLQDNDMWQTLMKRLSTDQGPYYALINRIAEEFDGFEEKVNIPSWAVRTYDWQQVRKASKSVKGVDLEKAGIIRKATRKVKAKVAKAERAFGVKARGSLNIESQSHAAKAYLEYQKGLEASAQETISRSTSFQLASALYQQDASAGKSPLLTAHRAVKEMKVIMGNAKDDKEKLFWDLLNQNVALIHVYIVRESACHLQKHWETDVLIELQDVNQDKDMAQLIMGPNGFAMKFIEGPAEPFISRSLKKGYYARKVLGREIPFEKEFFAYLSKSATAARPVKDSYNVKIRAYPTDTNRKAQLRPHSTLLELQCGDNSQRLKNFNYPVAKTFTWTPASCGEVTFQIAVGNLILSKTYTGYSAFAEFLNDFKTGQRVFYRSEFPSEEAALRRIGIEYIKAKYQFQGHQSALQRLHAAPGSPPRRIVTCWDR